MDGAHAAATAAAASLQAMTNPRVPNVAYYGLDLVCPCCSHRICSSAVFRFDLKVLQFFLAFICLLFFAAFGKTFGCLCVLVEACSRWCTCNLELGEHQQHQQQQWQQHRPQQQQQHQPQQQQQQQPRRQQHQQHNQHPQEHQPQQHQQQQQCCRTATTAVAAAATAAAPPPHQGINTRTGVCGCRRRCHESTEAAKLPAAAAATTGSTAAGAPIAAVGTTVAAAAFAAVALAVETMA